MTIKHSPGPWGISTNKLATGPVVVDHGGYPVAVVDPVAIIHSNDHTVVIRGTEQVSADANLIVSAPVMFDALVGIAKATLQGVSYGIWNILADDAERGKMRAILVAIAKARGKSVFGNDWQDALDGIEG